MPSAKPLSASASLELALKVPSNTHETKRLGKTICLAAPVSRKVNALGCAGARMVEYERRR